jgi:membrane-associated phospholipid phosphatase
MLGLGVAWAAVIVAAVLTDEQTARIWDRVIGGVPSLDYVATVLTLLMKLPTLLLLLALLVALDRRLRWRFAAEVPLILVGQMLANGLVKQLCGRLRPVEGLGQTAFLGPSLSYQSFAFPSGHAAAAFALAALLTVYYPRWRYVFLLLAAAVALARVQLSRHFFGDVVAGGVLGWYLAWALLGYLRRRWPLVAPSASAAQASRL